MADRLPLDSVACRACGRFWNFGGRITQCCLCMRSSPSRVYMSQFSEPLTGLLFLWLLCPSGMLYPPEKNRKEVEA
jgi:hypothetical protein